MLRFAKQQVCRGTCRTAAAAAGYHTCALASVIVIVILGKILSFQEQSVLLQADVADGDDVVAD